MDDVAHALKKPEKEFKTLPTVIKEVDEQTV